MIISVCIATYNGDKYIKEQLDSILCQLTEKDEIIISDDSSTDKTVKIIKSYKDNRINILENKNFKSPIFNFESSLKKAKGDVIFLADQDDIWRLDKVDVIKKYMQKYDLVLSDAIVVDASGKELHPSFYKLNKSKKGLINNLFKNSYLGCAMAFNRSILEKLLPFPKDIPMHDWWIGMVGEMCGETFFIEEKLISYRRHGNNISATGEKSKYRLLTKILFRFKLIKNLIRRYFI